MRFPELVLLVAVAGLAGSIQGETVKDREGAVRSDQAAMAQDSRWIYNDVVRGFREAKESGKPLLVVLRCVPCLACGGLDGRVIDRASDLGPLLDRFVCVRLINANTLDLTRFQFDFDLSFSTLIFNGDGTLYARFGSWAHQKNAQDRSVDSFRRTLEGALEVHQEYPANRGTLLGKQAPPVAYRTPIDLPTLAGKYRAELDWQGKVVPSCVHCHQIGDAFRHSFRDRGEAIPAPWIFPQPPPETIGLKLVSGEAARVESVEPNSLAARAGVRPGDDLIRGAGQRILSPADLSWILHGAPEAGNLEWVIRRDGRESSLTVDLPAGWRSRADISRRAGTWGMRAMALGGLQLVELTEAERQQLGLTPQSLGLRAEHVGEYGQHAVAKKAGFRKNDVVVEVEGQGQRRTEGQLIGDLLQRHRPGAVIPVVVQRGGERVKLELLQQ